MSGLLTGARTRAILLMIPDPTRNCAFAQARDPPLRNTYPSSSGSVVTQTEAPTDERVGKRTCVTYNGTTWFLLDDWFCQ